MTIPAPPADASGGFFVIKVASATQNHSMRFHVAPFTADAASLAYSPALVGGDASVVATFTAIATALAAQETTDRVLSMDSAWQVVGGGVVQVPFTAPATVAGTVALSAQSAEVFACYNFKTTRGGRAKFFIMGVNTADTPVQAPELLTPASGASSKKSIMLAVSATTSGIRGHDGAPLQQYCKITHGINRRVRRRLGWS